MTTVQDLLGETLVSVTVEDDVIAFETQKGVAYRMMHHQDCCESVSVESIVGDLNDLLGSPILMAEESGQDDPAASESGTWTFYKFATIKGYVDIRWYGSSNGYYSESVDFCLAPVQPSKTKTMKTGV